METLRECSRTKTSSQVYGRFFLLLSSLFFASLFSIYQVSNNSTFLQFFYAFLSALTFSCSLMAIDLYLKKNMPLRILNTLTLGIFFGLALGSACVNIFHTFFPLLRTPLLDSSISMIELGCYLTCLYIALQATFRYEKQLCFSIPFIRFSSEVKKQRAIILDASVLTDSRIIDLVSSGILDGHLLLPRCIIEEMQEGQYASHLEEQTLSKKVLETIRKLETFPSLALEIIHDEVPEIKELFSKILHLASRYNAHVLVSEISEVKKSLAKDVRCINIGTIAKALKPLAENGKTLVVKVQRYGKEERQGVGYLLDGTMVVINGGSEYLGKEIKVKIISSNTTSSGRMIFCNTIDVEEEEEAFAEKTAKDYFALRT
jgi:uncharacterized protein YacL